MYRRIFCCFCLGLAVALGPTPGRAAEQTNLVEILRAAMALPGEAAPLTNQALTSAAGDTTRTPHPGATAGLTNQALTLAAGDILELTVYQEDDLNLSRAVISRDGSISHPLLGVVPLSGKTLEQARSFIHDLLEKDYLVDPRVSLTVLEYAKYRLTLLKEVVRPDTYEVPRNLTLTLLQAIALAGGPTRQGNMAKITVQRVIRGEKQELKLDAESKEGKAFIVQPDDVIEIPPKGR